MVDAEEGQRQARLHAIEQNSLSRLETDLQRLSEAAGYWMSTILSVLRWTPAMSARMSFDTSSQAALAGTGAPRNGADSMLASLRERPIRVSLPAVKVRTRRSFSHPSTALSKSRAGTCRLTHRTS